MKTGGTCTLHKHYKTAQMGHTAGEVEVQPLSWSSTPHPSSEFKPWNKRTLCTVLCLCVGPYFKCKQLKLQSMAHSKR